MSKYLITYNQKGRILNIDTKSMTSNDFGVLQEKFAKEAGAKKNNEFAYMFKLWESYKINDIYYDYELAGPDGASFLLFAFPEHTKEDIRKAKKQIKNNDDVVRLSVEYIKEWI